MNDGSERSALECICKPKKYSRLWGAFVGRIRLYGACILHFFDFYKVWIRIVNTILKLFILKQNGNTDEIQAVNQVDKNALQTQTASTSVARKNSMESKLANVGASPSTVTASFFNANFDENGYVFDGVKIDVINTV